MSIFCLNDTEDKIEKNFWLKCFGIVYAISLIVFSFYTITFFFGNHDFYPMRFGVNFDHSFWEGRFTQFILNTLLFDGQILPILYSLIGFAFYSLASILLAKMWSLPQRKIIITSFSLLITLNSFILSHLYYVYTSISTMFWHLFVILGLYLALNRKKISPLFMWTIALLGYTPVINMIFTLIVASIIIDFLINDLSYKKLCKKYLSVILCALASILIYFVIFKVLQYTGIINNHMYNTQLLSFNNILDKIFNNLDKTICVLLFSAPFSSNFFPYFLSVLISLYIVVAHKKKKLFMSLLLLFALFIAMLTSAYISPYNIFYTYRINLFSVPYVIGLLFAIAVLCNSKLIKNIAFVCVIALILIFCNANFTIQKIWHLGNKQDEYSADRIKNDLLTQIDFNNKYRLYYIGGLSGRKKFADITYYRAETYDLYKEYYSFEYYLGSYLESSLFLTEKYNPIYGNLFIINGLTISIINNEFLTKEEKTKYEQFSKNVPLNKEVIRQWLINPKKDRVFVNDENIFIYFNENYGHYKIIMNYFGL